MPRATIRRGFTMRITKLPEQQPRVCGAVVMVRHEAFGKTPRTCGASASWIVETAWHAAKRTASLDGSAITRFTRQDAACDAHAALAAARVEMLNKF